MRRGVAIFDAPSNAIGGTKRNVISGNEMYGVYISGATASDNLIEGNYIGTDVTGLARLANQFDGVRIVDAPRTTIGGSGSSKRNLISGNDRHGVHISGATATGNVVLSNMIGLDLSGQNKLGNRGSGVVIDGAPGNTVGGKDGLENVISGNNESGILITGANAVGNQVVGNFIGTNQTGAPDLGNVHDGISLVDAIDNFIGGDRKTAGNLISGNLLAGVSIQGSESNHVYGNLIGTDNAAAKALPNTRGVRIEDSAKNLIGGVSSEEELANVISGNVFYGVYITGDQARKNVVDGNYIGTNEDGTAAIPNQNDGILIYGAPYNKIGVPNPETVSNVISGNLGYGVHVVRTDNTLVYNNFIGQGDGGGSLPNILGGVYFEQTTGNFLGGSRDQNQANLIAGNATGPGVRITDSRLDVIQGNWIGTNGGEPRPNLLGISVERSRNTIIGSLSSAQDTNIISGNITDGIVIDAGQNNNIGGNVIGLDIYAEKALPNGGNGVVIRNSGGNQIGRDKDGNFAGSVISGNLGNGILIQGPQARFNAVRGNFVGTNLRGDAARGNGLYGIQLYAASENLIGGARDPDGNLISGNTKSGRSIVGGRTNVVQGNFIGTDKSGMQSIPNEDGLELVETSQNWIGLSPGFETPDKRNLISGNRKTGLTLYGITTQQNVVRGNLIGVQKDGSSPLGNEQDGIRVESNAYHNTIGGITGAEANTIAFSGGSGIVVAGAYEITMRGNSIHDNAVLGIDLGGDGITLNDPQDSDSGSNDLQNFPEILSATMGTENSILVHFVGKPNAKYTIDFYRSPKCGAFGYGQGQWYLHSTTVSLDCTLGQPTIGRLFTNRGQIGVRRGRGIC